MTTLRCRVCDRIKHVTDNDMDYILKQVEWPTCHGLPMVVQSVTTASNRQDA